MTFDFAGGRRLLLAGSGSSWLWLLAGGLAVVLLLTLYREERKLVSNRVGIGLLILRLTAALVLVLALFEPIAARTWRETVRGRVLIAVDDSESMTTVDPNRPAAQLKALASSPGDRTEGLMRRDIARRLIDGPTAPLARLALDHDVRATAFARETLPDGPLTDLVESLRKPPRTGDPGRSTTDWTPALGLALKLPEDAPILGVVLLTDGRQNAPSDPSPLVDRLAARGIPVYPVLVGSTTAPPDAAVVSIKAPEGVNKGELANVSATIKLDGFPPDSVVNVTLARPGLEPMVQILRVPVDGSRPVVSFRVPMETIGTAPMTVSVEPAPGDARPDNDRKSLAIRVADDKARVLLVDGEARWEFRYLRNALTRDPRVTVDSIVFHQPASTSSTDLPYDLTWPARPDPSEPDPLGRYDAILIGDIDPADLTPETWTRLDAYVASRGGTLAILPGPRFWPTLAGEGPRALLPVIDPRPIPIDLESTDPDHPALPPGLALTPAPGLIGVPDAWPMLQIGDGPEASQSTWSSLPRLPWVVAGKRKPSSTLLVSALGREDEGAVIAAHPYGLGKVLWVGTDATWRWRFRVGDEIHHRFWGQVVRWAESGNLAAGNRVVRHGPLKPRIGEGESVLLQARVAEDVTGLPPNLLIAARIFRRDSQAEALAIVPMRSVPGQPRVFEGTAPTLPEGSYLIRLDAPELVTISRTTGAGPIPEAPLEVTPRETSERIELAAIREPLDRMAAATGGQVFTDSEAARLPELLKARTRPVERTEEVPLWDHPGTLILFFTILTAEWILRKRAGLP